MGQTLQHIDPEKIFKLANGMTISSLRQLLIVLEKMDDETFIHHANSSRNDFATWVRDVFKEDKLAAELQYMTKKSDFVKALRSKLAENESKELKEEFNINAPKKELLSLEKKVDKELEEGRPIEEIKYDLTKQGINEKEIEFIITNLKTEYKDIRTVQDIEDLEKFQQGLHTFKKYIMESLVKGRSDKEIETYLTKSGWSPMIVKLLIYDVYKSHMDIEKLHKYIHESIQRGTPIQSLKLTLQKMGWKDYVIDSALYGLHKPDSNLGKIVDYLSNLDGKDKIKIKQFLLRLGWKESEIEQAIKENEHHQLELTMEKDFNIVTGFDLTKVLKILNKGIAQIKGGSESEKFFKYMKNALNYRRLKVTDFTIKEYEMYADPLSNFCYNKLKFQEIEKKHGRTIKEVWFSEPDRPIITDTRPKFMIAPEMVLKKCVYCGNFFKLNNLEKIMKWDATKTHKVAMYVCKEHYRKVMGFFDENSS